MAQNNITYTDKVKGVDRPDIPDINKTKATDLNEIKTVVNANAVDVQTQLDGKLESLTGVGVDNLDPLNPVMATNAGDVGLGNADNTSDADKPISTATQTALNEVSFESLPDTPNQYTGDVGKFARVNGTETGLDFVSGTPVLLDSGVRSNFFRSSQYHSDFFINNSNTVYDDIEDWHMGFQVLSDVKESALSKFGYAGDMQTFIFGPSNSNFWLQIPARQFKYDNEFIKNRTVNVTMEIYSPVATTISINPYAKEEAVYTLISTNSKNISIGINIVEFTMTVPQTFDVVEEGLLTIRFFSVTGWNNQTVNFGRTQIYSETTIPINQFQDRWDEKYGRQYKDRYLDENLDVRRNLIDNYNHTRPYTVLNSLNDVSNEFETYMFYGEGDATPWSSDFIIGDAFSRFGYRGSMFTLPILASTTSNIFLFQTTETKVNNSKSNKTNGQLTFNLELDSSAACNLKVEVYRVNSAADFQPIGDAKVSLDGVNTSIGSVTVTADSNYVSYGLLLKTDDNSHYNKTIYVGRANFFDGVDDKVLEFASDSALGQYTETDLSPSLYMASSPYYNKKAVFLGDSITAQGTYQGEIVRGLGLSSETSLGIGGSMVTPYITGGSGQQAGDSIYFRADSVAAENADLIFLFGGQNDSLTTMGGDIPLGAITDTPYSGVEVASNPPSFYASYMGTLEKLLSQNLSETIHLITPLWSGDQTATIKKSKVDAIVEIGEIYGVKVTNLFTESGVNTITQGTLLNDTVHPSTLGGYKMGTVIANNLK